MAQQKIKKYQISSSENAPTTLEGHIFYGLNLDDEQKKFRDAIYDS